MTIEEVRAKLSAKPKTAQPEQPTPNPKPEKQLVEEPSAPPRMPFTREAFDQAWQAFTELRRKSAKSPREMYILEDAQVMLEGEKVTLVLKNAVLSDILEGLKPELTKYLQRALSNHFISIGQKIDKTQGSKVKRLYTDNEKLEHLKKKHPALNQLIERFDLDIKPGS